MKLAKISLAAAVALGALSTASFAQPLEEAIKGVDVSGMLRYRYTDDRFKNASHASGDNNTDAKHAWRVNADFKTPVVNNVAFNLGVVYNNSNDTNKGGSGSSSIDTGTGLGAGEDGDFGVATFYATVTPSSTNTVINVGKMRLDTPVTDALDDRGTGIIALNSDLPHWTFAGVALDTWALDDVNAPGTTSFTEGLYALAALASYGDLSAQVWYFNVTDAVKSLIFTELAYKYDFLSLKGQYAYSELDNGKGKLVAGFDNNKNALYTLEAGVSFAPVSARVGYIGSDKDGYKVSFDNQGTYSMGGKIWNDLSITGVNYSPVSEAPVAGEKRELEVFYGAVDVDVTDTLALGLEYVKGENKISPATGAYKVKFQEITPTVTYQYSKNLTLSSYYAMLKVKNDSLKNNPGYADAKQNELRFEALYKF
ncbi:MAG: major outer membrane protein [Wolinella succinogenes]|uniref:major outer membrane protein n=1 Tax=Wolinella succinogenes TaxID=844 RepID=UPI0016A8ADC1|nr:major outer membrane protein [Wolinella succinogenes]NLU35323.1 major outer membrane protein [Wolinella succinogenes]